MHVLITGAGRGIGHAIALRFSKHDVTSHYHTSKPAIGHPIQADLHDPEAAWAVAEEAAKRGPIDALIHNAGVYDRRAFAEMTGAAWRDTMAVNVDAAAAMTQAALPHMAPDASIVFLSSIVTHRGSSHGAHYTASKAALEGLTKALARELAPRRVNCVAPGYVDTDMIAADSPERRAKRIQEVPLGRVASPEDIAGVVAFLCSRDAAYITGQTIRVDGGLS